MQITFDTGFHRELTLTSSDSHNAKIVRAPQPETVRDYALIARLEDGKEVELARVVGQSSAAPSPRVPPVHAKSVRLEVTATNGSEQARVYEVRCYG